MNDRVCAHTHPIHTDKESKSLLTLFFQDPIWHLFVTGVHNSFPMSSEPLNTHAALIWETTFKGNLHFPKSAFTNHVSLEKLFLFIFPRAATARAASTTAPCPALWWRLLLHHAHARFRFLIRSYQNKTELVLHAELHTDVPEKIASQQNEDDEHQQQDQHGSQQVPV